MQNQALLEMLAVEKFRENLKLAQEDRIAAQASRESSSSIWKMILTWAYAGKPTDNKPARA